MAEHILVNHSEDIVGVPYFASRTLLDAVSDGMTGGLRFPYGLAE